MTDQKSSRFTPKPANKRGAARLHAVQALYQMELSGAGVLETVAEFEAHRLGKEIDGEQYRDADPAWFRGILSGVVQDQSELDISIRDSLMDGWSLSRLDNTMRAILRAGVWELKAKRDVAIPVVVNEYVEIAKAFYDDGDEPKMVNAILDRVARLLRKPG
ncbi:MAG: transcription antitermination factor NusB [Pseudomonadota bacterium]